MPAGLRQIQDPAKPHIFIETKGCISLFSYYRRKRQIQTQEIVANGQAFLVVNKLEVAQIFSAHFSSLSKKTIVTGITMITPVLPVIQVSRLYRDTALREKLFSFAL